MLVVRAGIVAAMLLCGCSMPASYPNVHEEEVRLGNGDVTLDGTLYLPAGSLPHPAVVIFHGSGPQARDSFMGRWFAEQGIACLTYDKRGVGESTGDFQRVAFPALVDDGLAAISFLKTRAGIDPRRIGVWGLSQGGWLGPLAASRSKDVAFVIAVSGPGVSPEAARAYCAEHWMKAAGYSEADVNAARSLSLLAYHCGATDSGWDKLKAARKAARNKPWYNANPF